MNLFFRVSYQSCCVMYQTCFVTNSFKYICKHILVLKSMSREILKGKQIIISTLDAKVIAFQFFEKKHNQCYQACRDLSFFNTWAPWDMLPLWQDNTTPMISNDSTQTRSPDFSNVMLTCYTLDRYKQKASNTVMFFSENSCTNFLSMNLILDRYSHTPIWNTDIIWCMNIVFQAEHGL
jgi:hypothetical protein